jgi:LacI family transcriptional regulator
MRSTAPRIMVLLNAARGYDRALMRGMARYAHAVEPVMFFSPPPFWKRWDNYSLLNSIREIKVDGLILEEQEEMTLFRELNLPMVVSAYRQRRVTGAINIVTDHKAVGRMAAETLLRRGFRQFAFCGYADMFWSNDRLAGFRNRLAEEGGAVDVFGGDSSSPADENVRLMKWLTELPWPCGLFACVDERAQGIIELAVSCGLRVPDMLSVIGVDDDELLCDLSPVPLSSIALAAERAGEEAIRRLTEMIRNKKNGPLLPDILIEPTYCVERFSTDYINIEDEALAKAIRFIRSGARAALSVEDVVKASGVSRRVLEKRFKKSYGVSIYQEIRRVRVVLFARMLAESTCTVAKIAEHLGFDDVEHISRYFKAETGLTPSEYRRQYGAN